ncbi:MAG TPA: hypothetical protein VEK14_03910 [Rhodomicrobium sp.]|nr:hypothetical protein [Rhodomicrobium sp.]
MTTPKTSRRSFLAAGPATAVFAAAAGSAGAAIAALSAAPAQERDPIYAAIENHRRALAQFEGVCDLLDKVKARQEGRCISQADQDEYERKAADETEALRALAETPATTVAGLVATLRYLVPFAHDDEALLCFAKTTIENAALLLTQGA